MMTAPRDTAILQVRDLTRKFGAFAAASGVTFDVPRGQIFGFLGPNGSGKSTTIRMLAGLLAPSGGRVTGFDGLDVVRDTERWKQRTGYMGQTFSLYLDLTVRENLQFMGSIHRLPPARLDDRIHELAATLKFEPLLDRPTSTLSAGHRQGVALAASLLHEPELLVLDEPTSGVDPRGRRLFWELIYELTATRGTTVVMTTHAIDEAEQCDRLAFMLNGRLMADGQPNRLKEQLRGRIFEVEPSRDPFAVLPEARRDTALEDAYLSGVRLRLVATPGGIAHASSLATTLGAAHAADPSLDDVFVSLARQQTTLAAAGADGIRN
jgi:ABC-2 type transport system ATP-binding protein